MQLDGDSRGLAWPGCVATLATCSSCDASNFGCSLVLSIGLGSDLFLIPAIGMAHRVLGPK